MKIHIALSPRLHVCAALAGLGLLCVVPARAEKLVDFSFNEAGKEAKSGQGARLAVSLSLVDNTGQTNDLHSAPGTGVSGKSGDRAFDCTSAMGMGKSADPTAVNYGPVATSEIEIPELSSLVSYTITGWFMASNEPIQSASRLVSLVYGSSPKPMLEITSSSGPGSLNLSSFNSTQAEKGQTLRSFPGFALVNEWVFFAVTYSSVGEKAKIQEFFQGSSGDTVARAGYNPDVELVTGQEHAVIFLGNIKNRQRPFRGLIDNVRIFGSTKDASGALTIPELDALRKQDINGGAK